MRYGATTVIDATHNSTKSFRKYKPLAEKYGYKVYCITFTAPIPELMRRNAERPAYKVVPHDCIYAMAHKYVVAKPQEDLSKSCSKKFRTHLMAMTSAPLKTSRNRTTVHSSLRYAMLMANTSSTSMRTISISLMLFPIPTILLVLLLTHSSHKQSYSK